MIETLATLVGSKKIVDPPTGHRSSWLTSRLVINDDGTTTPVLHILAQHKFVAWDPKTYFPFWIDKDWHNESLDNVALAEMPTRQEGRQKRKYSAPCGSKEYQREYRRANKEKHNEYHRKRRAMIIKLKEMETQIQVDALADRLASITRGQVALTDPYHPNTLSAEGLALTDPDPHTPDKDNRQVGVEAAFGPCPGCQSIARLDPDFNLCVDCVKKRGVGRSSTVGESSGPLSE